MEGIKLLEEAGAVLEITEERALFEAMQIRPLDLRCLNFLLDKLEQQQHEREEGNRRSLQTLWVRKCFMTECVLPKKEFKKLFRRMISLGFDINAIPEERTEKFCALQWAAESGWTDTVKVLLKCGADMSTTRNVS